PRRRPARSHRRDRPAGPQREPGRRGVDAAGARGSGRAPPARVDPRRKVRGFPGFLPRSRALSIGALGSSDGRGGSLATRLRRRSSVSLIVAAVAALAGGSVVGAGAANGSTRHLSDQSRYTLASWHGAYGYVLTGSVFGPDGTKLADEAAVGVANPDGAGH